MNEAKAEPGAELDHVIAEYLAAAQTGRPPAREDLLSRHPAIAGALAEFLDNCEWAKGVIPQPPPKPTDPFLPPHRVGRIDLMEVVGRGSFGTVYKGWDGAGRRWVAVKAIRKDAQAAKSRSRAEREFRIAAQLTHHGIVRAYDIGESADVPYFVSEYVAGQTLAARLDETRRTGASFPTPDRAAELIAAVADAVEHAHQRGVVHRDVKPANVILRDDRTPLLTDFGLALWVANEETLTADGRIIGTLAYMSPEQASGHTEVDGRSDVYSLGVMLYELLTGERPFVGNVPGMLHQIKNDDPRPPRSLDNRVPRDLDTVCLRCLQKEPARRYASAAALAADLRRHLDRRPVLARPVGRAERAVRWGRRNPAAAAAAGLAVVLLVATAAVSAAWAVHAKRQTEQIEGAFHKAKIVTAETEFDRGLGEAERGDVGLGLLWMARSLETAAEASDRTWAVRANLTAWQRELVTLADCQDGPPGRVLAFSAAGRTAWFVAADGKTVRGWDLPTAKPAGATIALADHAVSLAASPDGTRVACCDLRNRVSVWDANTGRPEAPPDQTGKVVGVAYSPDPGELILGTSDRAGDEPGRAAFHGWAGAARLSTAFRQAGPVVVAVGPGGRTLWAAGPADKELRGWTVADGRSHGFPLRHHTLITAAAVSPDGSRVLTGGGDQARLWEAESGRLLAVLNHRGVVSAVAFDRDGRTLRTAGTDAIRVWVCPSDQDGGPSQRHAGRVRAVAVSPRGDLVATGADDRAVRLWNLSAGTWAAVTKPLPHPRPILGMAFSPDGAVLASTSFRYGDAADAGVWLWDVPGGTERAALPHPATVHQLAFSRDGQRLATAGDDNNVWVWDVPSGRPAFPKPLGHEQPLLAVAFSAAGRFLATGGWECGVRRWDARTGERFGDLLPHDGPVKVVAFHPTEDHVVLGAGDDGTARLWDVTTGTLLRTFPHAHPIWVAAFSPDGRTVLTGGRDGLTRVWDRATGREVGRALRHGGWVRAVAVSPDGRWAVTGSDDGTARMWASDIGRPIGPPVRHAPRAHAAAIDPLGRWVVSAGEDRTARLQPPPREFAGTPEDVARRIQVAAGAELTPHGDLRVLDPAAWRQRRSDSGGPTGP